MCKLKIPENIDWELIVVNNNCTDATVDVIELYKEKLPIRGLFEPNQGLSNARNCAAAAAKGDLILWTDDDVLVDPNWISEYLAAARDWPEASFFGGTIDPWFISRPPRWILQNLDLLYGVFAIRQLGNRIMKIDMPKNFPYGANMAMRKRVFHTITFNPDMGHRGTTLICGEEVDFMSRLMALGHSGVWVGTASVRHYIPRNRLTKKHIWEHFRGVGQSNLRVNRTIKKHFQKREKHQIHKYYKLRFKSLVLSPFNTRKWLKTFRKAAIQQGMLDELNA